MPIDSEPKAGIPPFDTSRLDELMERSGLDVVVATSRHNVQYLLGGYRFFFFETIDAAGINRFLPVVVYWKGRPERTTYIGSFMEGPERERGSFWNAGNFVGAADSVQAMAQAITLLQKSGLPVRRIGIEASFLPAEAANALGAAFADSAITDAHRPLELLRAVKNQYEIELVRRATEGVAESILSTFAETRVGMTKHEMIATVRRQEFVRGIDFNFCQATIGSNLDRTPTNQALLPGEVVSLDCVGNVNGYIGDICRMGVVGEPDAELEDILGVIQHVQAVVRQMTRAGIMGGDLIAAGDAAVRASPYGPLIDFTVHGLGLVAHESPRLVYGRPLPYPASDAELPIEAGMVLSVETAVRHATRGFIKLEDTVIATHGGNLPLGDIGRDWNRIGGG